MKNRLWKKTMAVLLAISMVGQNGVITIAEETPVESQEVVLMEEAKQEEQLLQAAAESEAAAEAERQRKESEAAAEAERQRKESEAAAESERQRKESEAAAESERQRKEAEAAAESERQRKESEAAAESERQRKEAEAAAESERQRKESEAAAESERQQKESETLAETTTEGQTDSTEQPLSETIEHQNGTEAGTEAETEINNETLPETEQETSNETITETEQGMSEETEQVTESVLETEEGTETETWTETESETESETEPETEEETETETETEEEGPTELTAVSGGVKITLTAEPGVLLPGTQLAVKRVSTADAAAAIETTLNADQSVEKVVAFDITLLVEGKEVQPDGRVQVSFSNIPFTAEAVDAELLVAHVSDSMARASVVETTAVSAADVTIETTHFSVYAIAVVVTEPEKEPIRQAYTPQNSLSYTYTDANGVEQIISSPAFDFHIFAAQAEINNHTNGNIAANDFSGSGSGFGTNQNSADGVVEYNYFGNSATGVGTIASGVTIVGSSVGILHENGNEVYIGTNGTKQNGNVSSNVYQETAGSDKYLDIEAELNKLTQLSTALAQNDTSAGVKSDFPQDMNGKITVDISESSDQVNYLNVTAAQLKGNYSKPTVLVKGSSQKTLIINVDMTGMSADALAGLVTQIEGYNNGEDVVRSDCNLLWNFYTKDEDGTIHSYSTGENTYAQIGSGSDYFMGTILAPSANVQYGALNGSVIAQKTKSSGKESHNWRYTGLSAKLTVYKTLSASGETNKTFYFALFSDAAGTVRVPDQRVRSVTISDGQTRSIAFSNLKVGSTYYVFETDAAGNAVSNGYNGYQITGNGSAVTLTQNQTAGSICITNCKDVTGSLKITKHVRVNGAEATGTKADGTYYFTIYNKEGASVGTHSITITNGISNTVQVDGLIPGTYTVREDTDRNPEGMSLLGNNNVSVTVTGNNTAGIQVAEFTNNKEIKTGSLKVSKTVAGNAGDKNKRFTFTVRLEDTRINGSYGEMNFVNGVAAFTLKDGESKTASNLPVGVGYTVTEANYSAAGYETTYAGNTKSGTICENETAVVDVTNTKNTYGSLRVSKTVAGNAGDKNKRFTFTVRLEDTRINGTFGEMSFVNGVAAFTLKDGESKTASDLPNGVSYTVTEADYSEDGYVTTYTGNTKSGVIVEDTNAVVDVTNTRNAYGSLTVRKTVAGNAGDQEKEFTFTIELSDTTINGEYSGVTFEAGKAEITLKHGESQTIEGLPNGVGYTVTEADYSADGYTTTYAGNTKSGVIAEGTNAVVDVTNTRNAYGSLTVSKTVAGNAGDQEKEFTFTIELSDTTINGEYSGVTFEAGKAEITLKHGESQTIEGLPNGVSYTVTEADYSADGYVTAYAGNTNSGVIAEGTNAVVDVTNTRNAYGSLIVSKTVAGNAGDQEKEFTFTIELSDTTINGEYSGVTFEAGKAEIILKHGESQTIEGLPNGVGYTVTEADYSADGYETTYAGNTKSGVIAEGTNAVVDVTNTRNAYGSLTVNKTVAGNAGDRNKNFTFIVRLQDTEINGSFGEMNFVNGVASFALKDGESKTASDLPNGVGYTVTEADYSADGYETIYAGNTNSGIISENAFAVVDVTNTRNAYGSLTVNKTVAGNAGDQEKEFTFTIELSDTTINGEYSGVAFEAGKAEITLKHGESQTIEGLPNGVSYTVTEADYSADGYETTYAGNTNSGVIAEGTNAVVDVTNTRNAYGSLTVSKTVAGNAGDQEKEFTFTIELSDTTINGEFSGVAFEAGKAEITLKHGESQTIEGLPNGVSYTVTEADYSADGYETIYAGNTNSGVIAEGTNAVVDVTNTRNAYGSLAVSKTVAGNAGDQEKEFTFTIELSDTTINGEYSGVTFEAGKAEITLKHGESQIIEGLPNGVSYTVTEADYSADGYVTTYAGNTNSGIISENASAVVDVTNTRNAYGSLTVSKTVAGNAGDQEKEFTFTIELSDTTINGEYSGVAFEAGKAEVTLKHGERQTIEGLPNGVSYTVTEADYSEDGYETTYAGNTNSGTITEGTNAVVDVTNTRNANTSVTVVKTVTYNGLPIIAEGFSFYVALYEDAACTQMVAGPLELKVESGNSAEVTFDQLEIGKTYYVGECDAAGNVVYSGELIGGVTYQAKFTGTNGNVVVTEENGNTVVALDNQIDTWPDGYYAEGKLHVTKQLLRADGTPKKSSEVFYAGIFSDPQYTKLADNVASNILKLDLAGGSQVTASTSVSLPSADASVTVYVTEVDANGNPVAGAPGFAYNVTVSSTELTISPENLEEYVVITNQEPEEETETEETETEETETEETETEETETETEPDETPKTGDTTNISWYLLLMLLSASTVLILLAGRRRRTR